MLEWEPPAQPPLAHTRRHRASVPPSLLVTLLVIWDREAGSAPATPRHQDQGRLLAICLAGCHSGTHAAILSTRPGPACSLGLTACQSQGPTPTQRGPGSLTTEAGVPGDCVLGHCGGFTTVYITWSCPQAAGHQLGLGTQQEPRPRATTRELLVWWAAPRT